MGCAALTALFMAGLLISSATGSRSACTTTRALLAEDAPEYFIQVRDGQLTNGCNYFKLAGWNQWEVVDAAAGAPKLYGASIPPGMTGPQLVSTLMKRGAELGFNVMRTWTHAVNAQYSIQPTPGMFSEPVFKGLDYVVEEARKHGIKLILAFTSNWTPTGGLPEYLKWAGAEKDIDFFTDPSVEELYQEYVKTIITRRNSINGRLYSEDPTIMAWNLINEPRCANCPPGTIAKWMERQAAFVRALDPNHLITTGEEGFYGCCNNPANPGVKWSEWAAETGQDFIADHSSPAVDFATIHSWPDNWQDVTEEFQRSWIKSHVEDAAKLNKLVVLEEWGKWVNLSADASLADRQRFMTIVFDEVEKEMSKPNSPLQGSLFWQWYLDGQEGAPTEGGGGGLYGIFEADEAFALIANNAKFIQSLNGPIPGCSAATPGLKLANVPIANDCAATWVGGLPGTGMEGPDCAVPINECVRNTADCDINAACIDTPAGFGCRCHLGFLGDGKACAPDPAAQTAIRSRYWSDPRGLSCKSGLPVEWPVHTAGWVYDPTGSFAFYDAENGGRLGNKINVTLDQCMAACEVAQTCESFAYNAVLNSCFLARGQCPVNNFCGGEAAKCVSYNDRGTQFEFDCGYWETFYRLDSAAAVNCEGFAPDPLSVGASNPLALQAWEAWRAANPAAPLRETPPMVQAAGVN